ncbi:MAG: heavy-metal-associated domain-containing protein [Bacteroidales bacterium]|nr:heavy-metal-associated domain-containing protein [Bacteroidales bacterium]
MKTYTFFVENLKCGGCVKTISKAINKFSSVQNLSVDAESSKITVELDGADNQLDHIKRALFKIGYPEMGSSNNMFTEAKSYVSCAIGRMGI